MIPEFILLHTGRSRNLPSGGVELITRCWGRSLSQMALLKHHDTIPTFPRLALNPPGWIGKAQLTFLEEIQAKECFRMLIPLLSLLLTLFHINSAKEIPYYQDTYNILWKSFYEVLKLWKLQIWNWTETKLIVTRLLYVAYHKKEYFNIVTDSSGYLNSWHEIR